MQFTGEPTTALLQTLQTGLNNLQRSRQYYANGMKRFDDVIEKSPFPSAVADPNSIDPTYSFTRLYYSLGPFINRR